VSCGDDGQCFRWDCAGPAAPPRPLAVHAVPLTALAAVGQDGAVVAGGADGVLWYVPPEGGPQRWRGLATRVTALAASADGACIAAGGVDGEVGIFFAGGAALALGPMSGSVGSMAFAADGCLLIAVFDGSEGLIELCDPTTGSKLGTFSCGRPMAVLPVGAARLVVLGVGGDVLLRDRTGAVLARLPARPRALGLGERADAIGVIDDDGSSAWYSRTELEA
jgi:hypothetical protein